MITNTHSVGTVRDAAARWMIDRGYDIEVWALPIAAETFDVLNDVNGFHVKSEHAIAALDSARGGRVTEGSVGGGTGMVCMGFKGGIGTSSRRVGDHTLGVLVQCNFGSRRQMRLGGVPVGRQITGHVNCLEGTERPGREWLAGVPRCDAAPANPPEETERGSIIIVVATDAPLLPHQLKRIATRATLGVARMGGTGGNGSGDIFIAFSTANPGIRRTRSKAEFLSNDEMSPLFEATAQATEEAIANAMFAGRTMVGADNFKVWGLPHDQVRDVLRRHSLLKP
jgi:D-aminopeptidase